MGQQQRLLAEAHEQAAYRARSTAAAYERGERGEQVVRRLLDTLIAEGWTVLHDRRWPGKRRANLDHVVVGPGGVVVIDTKSWRGDLFLGGGRLWRDQDDATDAVDGLLAQVQDLEDVLTPHGLAPLEIVGALVFVGQTLPPQLVGRAHLLDEAHLLRWLRARGQRLGRDAVGELGKLVGNTLEPSRAVRTLVPVVVRPRAKPRQDDAQEQLFTTEALDLAELERASKLPLEQWMTYLHPMQMDVVRRRHSGTSRVRGPAGCGKTVVALHRAAYLAAQEPGELLVLSYVKTLPVVLSSLYRRLSSQTADRVTFSGIHKLAYDVVGEAGLRVKVDPIASTTCFHLAWSQHGRGRLDHLPRSYWQEEVQSVIKGRGLIDFDDYRQLARTGRKSPLSAEQRAAVWDVFIDYERRLAERGLSDFADVVALALGVVRRGGGPRYRFVLVDEAQDLDLNAIRLAAALCLDERDGLTLVGDGQQSLYAGGYTLKEAGLSVTGRATVLSTNYRSTRQIVMAAQAVVEADTFDDFEGTGERGDRAMTTIRDGSAVRAVTGSDGTSLDVALSSQLHRDRAIGLADADAAVLCRTTRDADRVRVLLGRDGHPVMDLADYDGTPVARVKVGTVKRSKGLEFGRVYLPRVDTYACLDGEAEPERVERERRELFVAMTRARDGLWTSRLVPVAPSSS